jgi:hypothetical protein
VAAGAEPAPGVLAGDRGQGGTKCSLQCPTRSGALGPQPRLELGPGPLDRGPREPLRPCARRRGCRGPRPHPADPVAPARGLAR